MLRNELAFQLVSVFEPLGLAGRIANPVALHGIA
jgi:hypothetical protein